MHPDAPVPEVELEELLVELEEPAAEVKGEAVMEVELELDSTTAGTNTTSLGCSQWPPSPIPCCEASPSPLPLGQPAPATVKLPWSPMATSITGVFPVLFT